jgi:hypothetical protein
VRACLQRRSIVRKGRLGSTLGRIGQRRNKRKEAPNTCTLQPYVSHHGHPLPFPSADPFRSLVCTALLSVPWCPVQPAQGCCRPFTARVPFSTAGRTWPACLPDRRFCARRLFSLPPSPSPSTARPLNPTTDLASSALSALTDTRPTQQLDTPTGPPRQRPYPSLVDFYHHCKAPRKREAHQQPAAYRSSLVRNVPSFVRRGPCSSPLAALSREALVVRDGARHDIERAINSLRRNRTPLQYAARHAARPAAAALRRAALHDQRPHQVGKWLRARRLTAPIGLVALLVAAATTTPPLLPSYATTHERHAVSVAVADAGPDAHAQQQQLHSPTARPRVWPATTAGARPATTPGRSSRVRHRSAKSVRVFDVRQGLRATQ